MVKKYIKEGWKINDEQTLTDERPYNKVIPLSTLLLVLQNNT